MEETYALCWQNESYLVEGSLHALRLYDRDLKLQAYRPEGALLLACNPASQALRYLARPAVATAAQVFRDWHWENDTLGEPGDGTVYTRCCAFAGNGSFASGGDWEDGGYWDGTDANGQIITGAATMPAVCSMAFAPDGSRLLLGGRWHYCAIWPFLPGRNQEEKTFEVPGGIVNAVAWSDSGHYIAALSTRKRLMVWDVQQGLSLANVPAPTDFRLNGHQIRFVPGAEHLVWVSTGSCAQLINWRRRVVVHTIPECLAFALSPSGKYVAYRRKDAEMPVVLPLEALAG